MRRVFDNDDQNRAYGAGYVDGLDRALVEMRKSQGWPDALFFERVDKLEAIRDSEQRDVERPPYSEWSHEHLALHVVLRGERAVVRERAYSATEAFALPRERLIEILTLDDITSDAEAEESCP